MMPKHLRSALLVPALLLASGCAHRLSIPSPGAAPPAPLPELPDSTLELPVTLELSEAAQLLEREVPARIDATRDWTMVANDRVGIKYALTRAPIQLALDGPRLAAAVTASYQAEACLKSPLSFGGQSCPRVASCGIGERPRAVRLELRSEASWSPDWRLATRSRFDVTYPDPCQVTFLHYDVTPHLDGYLRPQLAKAAADLDARVARAADLRARAEEAWKRLAQPIPLPGNAFLLLHPRAAHVSPLSGRGLSVDFTVGLTARPVVHLGAPPAEPPPALPRLEVSQGAAPGFHVALDGRIPYAEANRQLAGQLSGKSFDAGGHTVTVRDLSVSGAGGLAVVKAHVASGPIEGDLYLVGRPVYDPATATISLADLDYSLETRDALSAGLEWLLRGTLLEKLREKGRFAVGPRLEALRSQVETGLNRTLAPGISLSAQVRSLRPVAVQAAEDALVARVEAEGQAKLLVAGLRP
ncbi:DUF4403 family protein [Anaeromyxobacter paludicola]|uniref:DUF4403 family protein n=1 Tax=Anaeromyxobacter paludicola TaxID=2918171 RepID=A0ABM7XG38_9BACT|nr:DUF4403 family protein [Anaeromyxobacter paludicola]BDG10862.1 hypothetical protein AMPC_39750 [Anaeromyxobacter paludicola]